jgi:hypothetical protein
MPPPAVIPPKESPIIEEHAFRQTTTKRRVELAEDELEAGQCEVELEGYCVVEAFMYAFPPFLQPIQFKADWLGQIELNESELEGVERSQAALNQAIAKCGRNPGREVILEIGGNELRLLSEEKDGEVPASVLMSEPIQRIRCWAIGRENPRFAFPIFLVNIP